MWPRDQLHRDVEPAVGEPAQLVDRDDPRMLELAADLRLLDEPPDHLGMVTMLLQEDFHGQVAAEVHVATLQDRPDPPSGDLAEELVPAGASVGSGISSEPGRTGLGSSTAPSRSRMRGTGPIDSFRTVRTPEGGIEPADREKGLRASPGWAGRRSVRPDSSSSLDPIERLSPRPRRSKHRGQSPPGELAGRSARHSGHLVSATIMRSPRRATTRLVPDSHQIIRETAAIVTGPGRFSPHHDSRAAKRARISSSMSAGSSTVAAISCRRRSP